MSVLNEIQTALSSVGFTVGEGKYPQAPEPCGKIIFIGEDAPVNFMGGGSVNFETFKIIVRGDSYRTLEQKTDLIRSALKSAGKFIPIGGYEDVEPKDGEDEELMQLAVSFKAIK